MKDTITRGLLKAEAHPAQPVLEVINLTKRFEVNGTSISVRANLSFNAGISEMVCIAGRRTNTV
jgi:ABC-type glutathione transport system ATPase component